MKDAAKLVDKALKLVEKALNLEGNVEVVEEASRKPVPRAPGNDRHTPEPKPIHGHTARCLGKPALCKDMAVSGWSPEEALDGLRVQMLAAVSAALVRGEKV